MKKIMIIDGGPRKNMNTAAMVEAFMRGAQSVNEEVEVKHVRLYDINYKGCRSCLACQIKGSKFKECCGFKDGLTDILKETSHADGICFASPIYFGDITAETHAFMERLYFPWLSYNDYSTNPPKRVPTAFIYTMNAPQEYQEYMSGVFDRIESINNMFLQKPERIKAINTCQVKDYDKYDMAACSKEDKLKWRDEHFEKDLNNAFEAGKRMAKKIIAE
jgi:multimeric flavodoxin WrbA